MDKHYKDDNMEIKIIKGPLKQILAVLTDNEKEHVLRHITKGCRENLPPGRFMSAVKNLMKQTPAKLMNDLRNSSSTLGFEAQLFTYFITLCKNLEANKEITILKENKNERRN